MWVQLIDNGKNIADGRLRRYIPYPESRKKVIPGAGSVDIGKMHKNIPKSPREICRPLRSNSNRTQFV